jgi:hypothetical protein
MTLLPLQSLAIAQSTNGRLVVTVKDERGDVIPGATVRVVNDGTQTEDSGVTEDGGIFTLAQVPVGTYTVTVDAQGFKTKVTQGVKIDVGQDYALVVPLEAGGVGESVTVTAGEELVKTTQTDITTTVSQKQVQDLPLDGRNPLNLVNLQAGTNANGRSNTAINGQRVSSVEVTQDGINIQDNFIRAGGFEVTTSRTTVSQVAEFSVTTSNASVDSAGASDVRLVTPSGTSELHGEVFEYHRNHAFGANDFFNNNAQPAIDTPKLIRNQFGFRLSGPVYIPKVLEQKDKLFFFGFYEGQRQSFGVPTDTLVLTPSARAGIFKYFDNSGNLRQINVLQVGGFQADPVAQALLAEVPQVNNNPLIGDQLNTYGYSFNKNEIFDRNQGGARLDYQVNAKHHIEAIYNYTGEQLSRDDVDTSFRTVPAALQTATNHLGVAAWNWTITDRLVNEVRVGTNNSTVPFFLTEERELPYVVVLPLISDPFLDTAQIAPQGRRTITSSFIDSASYSWGDHFFHFGAQVDDIRVRSYSSFGRLPEYDLGFSFRAPSGARLVSGDFPGGIDTAQLATANGLLALQAGIVSDVGQTFEATSQTSGFVSGALNVRNFIIHRYSAYAADSWRVHPKVTLNLGVRWDYTSPLRERDNLSLLPVANGRSGRDTVLDPDGIVDFVNGFYFNPDKNNFAPNIGVAWDVFGDGKTVVRGAYSIAYINDEAIRSFDNASSANSGLSSNVGDSVFGTLSGGRFNGNVTPNVADLAGSFLQPGEFMVPRSYADNFNLDPGAAAFIVDPNFESPFYHQWNLSVEREVGWDTAVSLRYVGNKSSNLARGVDYNQLDVTTNGFAEDLARARMNGFLALAQNGVFNPAYNPNIRGSQQLTVFPMLASGGLLGNATIQNYIRTGEAGTLAQIYYTNGLQGDVRFTANPNTFVADVVENLGESVYHSFQAEVRRRFTSGFGFQVNYTWSKTLTNASGLGQTKFEPPLDINNPNQTRTRAEYDIPHAMKANVIYELPFGSGKHWADFENGFLNKTVSGWQVSSIVNWQSGAPFSILSARGTFNRVGRSGLNGADSSLTSEQIKALFGFFDTPNGLYFINPAVVNPQVFNGSATAPGGTNSDGVSPFNGQVFFNPQPGKIGSLQAFQFNGPTLFTWDFGVIKRTPITETSNVEFRAEFFNILNHPVFFVGNQNINSNTFGKITQTLVAPRVIQLAVKINF